MLAEFCTLMLASACMQTESPLGQCLAGIHPDLDTQPLSRAEQRSSCDYSSAVCATDQMQLILAWCLLQCSDNHEHNFYSHQPDTSTPGRQATAAHSKEPSSGHHQSTADAAAMACVRQQQPLYYDAGMSALVSVCSSAIARAKSSWMAA